VDAVPESRSALATPSRVACSAGESPKRIPVPSATTSTNANVPKSGTMSTPSIEVLATQVSAHHASVSPAAPPTSASSVDSVTSCRSKRARDAPRESRTAISWRRPTAEATMRELTFIHATSRTRAPIPIMIPNATISSFDAPGAGAFIASTCASSPSGRAMPNRGARS
jgi:hypothetical protein